MLFKNLNPVRRAFASAHAPSGLGAHSPPRRAPRRAVLAALARRSGRDGRRDFCTKRTTRTASPKSASRFGCVGPLLSLPARARPRPTRPAPDSLQVMDHDTFSSDDLIGEASVDLQTLATGPVKHELLLTNKSAQAGRLAFKLQMEQVLNVQLTVVSVMATNLPRLATGADPSPSLTVSLGAAGDPNRDKLKVEEKRQTRAPEWQPRRTVAMQGSIYEVLESQVEFVFVDKRIDSKRGAQDDVLATCSVPVSKLFSFRDQPVKFREQWISGVGTQILVEGVGYVEGTLSWQGQPRFVQMVAGKHTDAGISGGQLAFAEVERPRAVPLLDAPSVRAAPAGDAEVKAAREESGRSSPAFRAAEPPKYAYASAPLAAPSAAAAAAAASAGGFVYAAAPAPAFAPYGGPAPPYPSAPAPSAPPAPAAQPAPRRSPSPPARAQPEPQGRAEGGRYSQGSIAHFSDPSLPEGWRYGVDPGTGRKFYIDLVHKVTQWDPPAPPQQSSLPPGWEEAVDEGTGYVYYRDLVNKRTQWERPT